MVKLREYQNILMSPRKNAKFSKKYQTKNTLFFEIYYTKKHKDAP